MIQLTVGDLLESRDYGLNLRLLAGKNGLHRRITQYRIQKSGLTLTGLYQNIHDGRIQILGQNEISYLRSLPYERQKEVLRSVAEHNIPAFIVTRGLPAGRPLLEIGDEMDLPILSTAEISSTFVVMLNSYLEINLASATSIHGVLMDVLGVGVLLLGQSGVGKSECALELLLKGHRLVADDIVEVKKQYPSAILGSCSSVIQHHMEIRGLGILNIEDLFGVTAVRDQKRIHLVLELVEWRGDIEYDRLGLEHKTYAILGVELPLITIPVSQGRNTATIVEVAARNFLLQEKGIDSALSFQEKLDATRIREKLSAAPQNRKIDTDGEDE